MGEQRPVVLTFDRPVNAAQIEAHLHISPTMMGRISWPTAQRLIFEPADRWAAKQWYQVSLEAGAQAEDGGMLDKLWSIRFMHGGRGAPLPILMYHHVTELGPEATESQRTWSVSPQMLQAQLDYLAAEGWQTISPEQLADYLVEGEPLPSKPLMITFDDGYREVYEHAYPLLAKTALRPTLFIIVDSVELGYSSVMDWAQLQELAAAGFYFGSHSKNHADLRRQNAADLDEQIGGSQRILEEKLGIRIQAFCYPYGSGAWDDAVLATLARYGYRTGYTINPTYYQNPQEPLRLGRLRISYEMSVEDLASLLPDF